MLAASYKRSFAKDLAKLKSMMESGRSSQPCGSRTVGKSNGFVKNLRLVTGDSDHQDADGDGNGRRRPARRLSGG
jgi:hypothetical protein